MARTNRLIAFLAVASTVLTACSTAGSSHDEAACSGGAPPPGAPVLELVLDPTASSGDGPSRTATVADAGLVVDGAIAQKGFLLVRRTGASVSGADLVCSGLLDAKGPNDVLRDRSRQRMKAEVLSQIEGSLVSAPSSQVASTDLFAALNVVADDLARFPDRPRSLVVRSDFVNSSEPYNLLAVQLDQQNIDRMVGDLRARRLLPSLPGVTVYLSGIGATASGHVGGERAAGLTAFWRAYFQATGADVRAAGTRLIAFP